MPLTDDSTCSTSCGRSSQARIRSERTIQMTADRGIDQRVAERQPPRRAAPPLAGLGPVCRHCSSHRIGLWLGDSSRTGRTLLQTTYPGASDGTASWGEKVVCQLMICVLTFPRYQSRPPPRRPMHRHAMPVLPRRSRASTSSRRRSSAPSWRTMRLHGRLMMQALAGPRPPPRPGDVPAPAQRQRRHHPARPRGRPARRAADGDQDAELHGEGRARAASSRRRGRPAHLRGAHRGRPRRGEEDERAPRPTT